MTKGKRYCTAEELITLNLPEGKARLRRFVFRFRRGLPQRPDDLAALASAFEQILGGEDSKKALSLAGVQSQGRTPRTSVADVWKHEEKYVAMVEQYLRDAKKQGIKTTVDKAIEAVAKSIAPQGAKFETIKGYRKKHGENVRAALDFWEENNRLVAEWRMRTVALPRDVVDLIGAMSAGGALKLLRAHGIDGNAPPGFVRAVRRLKKGGGEIT